MTRGASSTNGPSGQGQDAVRLSDLSVEYPGRGAGAACVAVRGVSLRVARGEVLGLLGSSGSGKSTLARLLAGRADESGGRATATVTGGAGFVDGRRLGRLSRRAKAEHTFRVGYLAQDAAVTLPAESTIAEIIAEPILSRDSRFNRTEAGKRVAEMLAAVQLPLAVLRAFPFELSSGQRQRVALARALVLGPGILIADEPVAAVDTTARVAVADLLVRLRRTPDFTAVVVNHDPELLRRLVDRIAVLDRGALVGLGTIDDVLADAEHPYAAALAAEFARSEH